MEFNSGFKGLNTAVLQQAKVVVKITFVPITQ